jgi:hypothetical protein
VVALANYRVVVVLSYRIDRILIVEEAFDRQYNPRKIFLLGE